MDDRAAEPLTRPDRRGFISYLSRLAMLGSLISAYGAFAAIAGRFLYPARPRPTRWLYVADLDRLAAGESLLWRAPGGETVNVARRAGNGDVSDFIALSSTCPHLGCQVHWEAANNRFFCPCHNGAFTPEGKGVAGPPGDAGQSLPRYPLRVEGRLLYIQAPVVEIAAASPTGEAADRVAAAGGCGRPCPRAAANRPSRPA